MERKEQGGGGSRTPDQAQQAQQPPPQPARDADATWGLGSAAALDTLRRRNFRGRRDEPDDRPSSE